MQNFWDPETNATFHYQKIESCWNPDWWYGEPVRQISADLKQPLTTSDVGNGRKGRYHYR